MTVVAAGSLVSLLFTAACATVLDIEDVPSAVDGGDERDASGDATTSGSDGGTLDGQADATTGDGGGGGDDAGDASTTGTDGGPPDDQGYTNVGRLSQTGTVGFGSAVAFSPDGKWLAVGAPGATSGTVVIFGPLDGGVGSFARTHTVSSSNTTAVGNTFGAALAFANDSKSLAVGAPADDEVVVYVLGTEDMFGDGVMLNEASGTHNAGTALAYSPSDGVLFVGAPGTSPTTGVVETFINSAATSTVYTESPSNQLGSSLAIAGQHLAVGAPAAGGSVSVGSTTAPLGLKAVTGTTVANSAEGTAVAFTPDGAYVLAGAPGANSVLSFPYDSALATGIAAPAKLDPPSIYLPGGSFGTSLAVSNRAIAVGAPTEGTFGAVYIYPAVSAPSASLPYSAAGLLLTGPMPTPTGQFGQALAMSPGGSTLAVGSPSGAGTVYLYQ